MICSPMGSWRERVQLSAGSLGHRDLEDSMPRMEPGDRKLLDIRGSPESG